MNWYAYKVLADTYDADRRAEAARHRRAREAARVGRERRAVDSARSGSSATRVAPAATPGWWSSLAARLRRRGAPAPAHPTIATTPGELRPSLPR